MTRVVLVVVSSAAFLGLAIWAYGSSAFLSHPALVAVAISTFVFALIGLAAGGNISPGIREDRTNRWVLVPFTVISILAAFVPALTDRANLWTIDGETARWIGVALFDAGCMLRIWPVFVLGDRFSGLVAIQPGHTLVTTGIYGVIRNPSYLGLLIALLGWSLAFRAAIGFVLTALIFLPLLVRIRAEERLLREQFGAQYEAYCARTWRLIPWIY